jgi:hypothetical protein
VSSPSESAVSLRQVLDEAQPVRRTLAREFHRVHGLADEVQSQSTGAYFIEGPPLELAWVNRWTAVTKKDFEPLLNFSFGLALRPSKVHGDGLIEPITVGMPHNVGESFIHRADDRPALHFRES